MSGLKIKYKNTEDFASLNNAKDMDIVGYYERRLADSKNQAAFLKLRRQGQPAPVISTGVVATMTVQCTECNECVSLRYYVSEGRKKQRKKIEQEHGWHAVIIGKATHKYQNDKIDWYCAGCADEAKFRSILL